MTPRNAARMTKRRKSVKAWCWKMRNNGRLQPDGVEFPVRAIPPEEFWLYDRSDGGFVEVEIRELPRRSLRLQDRPKSKARGK